MDEGRMNHATLPAPDGLAAALDIELRTLRERLIILRARDAALDQKIRQQAHQLEEYATSLFGLTEELRKNQNLTRSFQDHLGFTLLKRGRDLLDKFHHANLRERFDWRTRITELLKFQECLSETVYRNDEWPAVREQLVRVATGGWPPMLEGGVLTRGLRAWVRRCLGRLVPSPR